MKQPRPMEGQFDYIIVGAGSAGCVVANRLSANGKTRVLLLEAGGQDNWIWFHIPVGYLFAIGNPRSDWMFETTPQSGLGGRALSYPRGKVMGGSSAINAMISMRGQAADYDSWRNSGLTGWGWDDVAPVFRRIEDHFLGDSEVHGVGGEWRINPPRVSWPILDAVREGAAQSGIPKTQDFNTGDNEGAGYFHVNQTAGRRWSAAKGFLKPVLNRPNLQVETDALTECVNLDGNAATGVIFQRGGERIEVRARREVILCAGSIGSVQILQRSGIGPPDVLSNVGISTLVARAGVGENLQDHLQQRAIFKVSNAQTLNTAYHSMFGRLRMGLQYAIGRRGPLTMAPSQLGIFTRSSPEHSRANIQFHVQPLSLDKFGDPLHRHPAITIAGCNLRPTSRGRVHINSSDVHAAPEINPNYLATDADKTVAADTIKVTRNIMGQAALKPFAPEETVPGPKANNTPLSELAGQIGTTIFHPVGTAKMGSPNDPMAVVDARLRVIGVERLRVIDASVMPTITSGNTNTPTIMIADKISQEMAQER